MTTLSITLDLLFSRDIRLTLLRTTAAERPITAHRGSPTIAAYNLTSPSTCSMRPQYESILAKYWFHANLQDKAIAAED
jgi:hypothetical protein